jgi:hypothetical protein
LVHESLRVDEKIAQSPRILENASELEQRGIMNERGKPFSAASIASML